MVIEMRRFTDFIVKHRIVILIVFIIFSLFSIYLNTKVNINEDILKYLPKSSETKQGKDIMEEGFPKQDSSTLNVMFKNLSSSDKTKMLMDLGSIQGVESVDYDDSDTYNKDKYTLYVLNVDDYADSENSKNIYNTVKKIYKPTAMSGSIADENKSLLQLWVVILAIVCAMIILVILSDSYVEPFLYLISIGIAVFINKGTNIIFPSVSNITNSIVAILQLALSMDYSIMLSNRYEQEKQTHKNKEDAMKEALFHSFSAISSSSVTTIVGLLALVFMSFTIGKDLGLVLAKGVLLSLVSIFFCLPTLLLTFDNLIKKTKKKSPNFNLRKLGLFCYRTRYAQSILIVALFIVAFLLKGNIHVTYTGSEQDKVGAVFQANNQIAIVYDNKYEEEIAKYCKDLEDDNNIDKVLCYSNTINEKLPYDKLNDKFNYLEQDTNIDEELIKIIYYNYYNKDSNNKMTLNEFITFIKDKIYNNDSFNNEISDDTKDNLDLLTKFTDKNEINKKRSLDEISDILDIDRDKLDDLMILYNSKNINIKMSVSEFIDFILNDVSKDSKYNSSIDKNTISNLKQLRTFTDTNIINKEMNANELSKLFGLDEDSVNKLFMLYRITTTSNTKLTMGEFVQIALSLSNNNEYKSMFDEETVNKLQLLQFLSNDSLINQELDKDNMKSNLNNLGISLDDNTIDLLYMIYTGATSSNRLKLTEFANQALTLSNNDSFKPYFSDESKASLNKIINLSNIANQEMDNTHLYNVFNINTSMQPLLNKAITGEPSGTYSMTPLSFVNTLLSTDAIKSNLSSDTINSLNSAKFIMSNKDNTFTSTEISNYLSTDKLVASVVFGSMEQSKNISIKNLINIIYSNKDNKIIKSKLGDKIDLLSTAYGVVNNTTNKLSVSELSKIINLDSSSVNKIYGIYDYQTKTTTLSPYKLTILIIKNKDNSLLKGKLNKDSLNKIQLVNEVMGSSLNNKKYTKESMANLLGISKDKTGLLYSLYDSKHNNSNQTISLYSIIEFLNKDVITNKEYKDNFDNKQIDKIETIYKVMSNSLKRIEYTSSEAFAVLKVLSDDLDKTLIDLVYLYYDSENEYDKSWTLTIEEFVNYLNNDILNDDRFNDFINSDKRKEIMDAKESINKAKDLLVTDKYSRVVLNTKYTFEGEDVFKFIEDTKNKIGNKEGVYVVSNSSMAVEMSKSFDDELNRITILTIIFIFIVVAITFKDLIIPAVLVLMIQCAVYVTMAGISISGGSVYFISVLIVQAILMGATIDYAIVYTSYYLEYRKKEDVLNSIINAYNKSIHTILSSSSILIIVTLVVANFASAIAAKICETISEGTLAAVILILFILPGVLATCDKIICRKGYYKEKNIKKIKSIRI